MTEIVAIALLLASGQATRYRQGMMERVVANRVRWGQLPADTNPAKCVALLDACHIGRKVWLETPTGEIVGPLIVADCAQKRHQVMLKKRHWAVDLNWQLAMQLGVINRPLMGFKVWDRDPREAKEPKAE